MKSKSLFYRLAEVYEQHRSEQSATEDGRLAGGTSHFHKFRWFLPNGGTLLIVLLLILTQQVWANNDSQTIVNAPGPSSTTINYQGSLAALDGTPKNGTFGMSFAIYNAASGGSIVWGPENHSAVPVTDGLFNVGLGSQTPSGIPTTVWNGDRYLQISVGGEALTPRELIRSVPVAGMALTVPDGAINTSHLVNGAVTQEKAPLLVSGTTANTKIAHGQALAQQYSANPQTGTAHISLSDYGFTQTPTVLCSTAGPSGFLWNCHVEYETATTFTIWVYQTHGATNWSTVPVRWIAIGQ
jgi:hypothetical protein